MYPEIHEFLYGAITAPTATTFTLDLAKPLPEDGLVGKIASFPSGTAGGQVGQITENIGGVIKTIPTFSPLPEAGDIVEIWPEYTVIEAVNEHINLAIQRIA